jgi:hypothetical protein
MVVTLYKSPTTSGGVIQQWTTPQNVYATDNAVATAGNGLSNSYAGFGFTAPEVFLCSAINGFEVSCEAKNSGTSGNNRLDVWLIKGGVKQSTTLTNAQSWTTTTDAAKVCGSSSDTAGVVWTANDVIDPGFGIYCTMVTVSGTRNLLVDQLRLRVYVTPPSFLDVFPGEGDASIPGYVMRAKKCAVCSTRAYYAHHYSSPQRLLNPSRCPHCSSAISYVCKAHQANPVVPANHTWSFVEPATTVFWNRFMELEPV